MKYLVIGAGGTGGSIGAYMTEAGKDVTLIARGAHLKKMQEEGLKMETTKKGNYTVFPVKAVDMEHYDERPDIIFVCVKGYSLDDIAPFIRRVAKETSIVIPILNIYGTGSRLQEELPELLVTDGCIYVALGEYLPVRRGGGTACRRQHRQRQGRADVFFPDIYIPHTDPEDWGYPFGKRQPYRLEGF